MAQAVVCNPIVKPTVTNIGISPDETMEGLIAFSTGLKDNLYNIESQKVPLSSSNYAEITKNLRDVIKETGSRIINIFRENLLDPPTEYTLEDQDPSTIVPMEVADRENCLLTINALQQAALRAVKSSNFSRLGKLIDDLYTAYSILEDEETATTIRDTYWIFLRESLGAVGVIGNEVE